MGKVSNTAPGFDDRREVASSVKGSGRRARRATAMLPWLREERTRAMPAPVVGPAPRMMARPVNFRKSERERELISFVVFTLF